MQTMHAVKHAMPPLNLHREHSAYRTSPPVETEPTLAKKIRQTHKNSACPAQQAPTKTLTARGHASLAQLAQKSTKQTIHAFLVQLKLTTITTTRARPIAHRQLPIAIKAQN